jgi:Tol biopolymer transport system component
VGNTFGAEIWDLTTGGLVQSLTAGRRNATQAVSWSPDGRYLIAIGSQAVGDMVGIWDANGAFAVRTDAPGDPAWSPDGRHIAAVWHLGVEIRPAPHRFGG